MQTLIRSLTAGVSVFPDHPAVAAGWMNSQLLPHQVTEPGRVQIGAAADHTVPGQTAQLPCHVGQDVN